MCCPAGRRGAERGFTLVELLVALAAMALLSIMAWQGVDAMLRAQEHTSTRSADTLALNAGLGQWRADLDAMAAWAPVGGADFDGRVLRLTRLVVEAPEPAAAAASAAGALALQTRLRVVAWGARQIDGQRTWLRWQSPPLDTREALQAAWQQAALWGENPDSELRRREVAVAAIDAWQIFYFRNDSWSSPLSSAVGGSATVAPAAQAPLPDGVRLVLDLAEGQALGGRLLVDWVRPAYTGVRQ